MAMMMWTKMTLRTPTCNLSRLFAFFLSLLPSALSTKHNFRVNNGAPLIGPVGPPFGFNVNGHFGLTVYDFGLGVKKGHLETILDKVEPGFFLMRYDNEARFNQHLETLRSNSSLCSFDNFFYNYEMYDDDNNDDIVERGYDDGYDPLTMDDDDSNYQSEITSAQHGIFLSMKSRKNWQPATPSIEYRFKEGEQGLYFLIYQVCPYSPAIYSTFEVDFHFDNTDRFGNKSYLSAGEMKLPVIFFYFSISYLLLFGIWFTNITEIQKGGHGHFASEGERPQIYAIHQLMSLLLVVKFLSVFFESIRYHYIRMTGHAEIWTFLYYGITFVKGTFLFSVILLIGTGWSFVKPFLTNREKKMIVAVLFLQIINNIAIIALSQETEGETRYSEWTGILHIVDIICCCAVLVPIVWQVNELEKSVAGEEEDVNIADRELELESGDKGDILSKLKLFRSFYLIVVAYIYSTRILVYLFANLLNYKYTWLRYFVVELITLTFYVSVGFMFRPVGDKVYHSVARVEDSTRNENAIEMGSTSKKDNAKGK